MELKLLYRFLCIGFTCLVRVSWAQSFDTVRLNEISQKACHNCFEQKYSKSIYYALQHVKAIEIDIYDSKNILNKKGAVPYHWFVRHEGKNKKGNNNCCFSSVIGGNDLDSCLKEVAIWCFENPNHDFVTIFLDKKQSWSHDHTPFDLDHLILKYFDQNKLFKPSDLIGNFPSLREAAKNNNWPRYDKLKGKVLFVITGGDLLAPNRTLSEYVETVMGNGVAFVAPQIKKEREITNYPKKFKERNVQFVVFYNLNIKASKLACVIQEENFLSRIFNVPEDKQHFEELQSCTNYIAVFNFGNIDFSTKKIVTNANWR